MASYSQRMQEIFKQYQEEVSFEPVDLKVVGAWAIAKGLWSPRPIDIQSRFANDMADALREEYRVDENNLRYRSKFAITNGRQGSFWGDLDTSSRKHVEKNVSQRRKQIVGDCFQLQIDVDHYNFKHPHEEKLQLILDFTDDVKEKKVTAGIDEEAA